MRTDKVKAEMSKEIVVGNLYVPRNYFFSFINLQKKNNQWMKMHTVQKMTEQLRIYGKILMKFV